MQFFLGIQFEIRMNTYLQNVYFTETIAFSVLISAGVLYLSLAPSSEAMPHCESCGMVCVNFCNTREFRPCCINFIRKRSPQPALSRLQLAAPPPAAPGQEAEAGERPWQEHNGVVRTRLLSGGFLLDPAALDEAEVWCAAPGTSSGQNLIQTERSSC